MAARGGPSTGCTIALIVGLLGIAGLAVVGIGVALWWKPATPAAGPGDPLDPGALVPDRSHDAARNEALTLVSDPELAMFTVAGMREDGSVPLATPGAAAIWYFRSPKAAAQAAKSGAATGPCRVEVMADAGGLSARLMDPVSCDTIGSSRPPRCTALQILQRLKERHPSTRAQSISYEALHGHQWQIVDTGQRVVTLADDC
jgi:hypothetical protein